MGEFDAILDSLKPNSGGKRRRRGGAITRRGSVSSATIAQGLLAGGVAQDAADKIAAIIASAQNTQLEQEEAGRIDQTRAVVKAATELTDSTRALIESKLKETLDTLTYVYANVKAAGPAMATGAVVGVGAAGYAGWQSKYVREAMLMMMPVIVEDVKKYAKESLSPTTLFSIALFVFTILFLNSITKKAGAPTPAKVETDAMTVFEVEPSGEPTAEELKQSLAILDAKVAAAEAAQAAGKEPVWTGSNAVPLGNKSNNSLALTNGGRRRLTSRRPRRAAYSPKPTRRSSSGRRRGYSRRTRG